MKVGVLALQGAFREHRYMLERCGADVSEIRRPEDLDGLDGLVIPGGESTTIGKLMVRWGLLEKIRERASAGMGIYGTCAGMILLAKHIVASEQPRLALMDISVKRNAFGRQRESFEVDIEAPEIDPNPIRAVFIRAPYVESAGSTVRILAQVNKKTVIAREGKLLVTAFHPELTDCDKIHSYFIKMLSE